MTTTQIPYHHVASRFFNRPLNLALPNAQVISSFLMSRIDAACGRGAANEQPIEATEYFSPTQRNGSTVLHSPRNSRFVGEYQRGENGEPLPYRMTENGTAIITVIGELVNRGAWVGASSGLVSYEGLAHQVKEAVRNPRVRGILLDVDSPGGEAIGCYELASVVRNAATVKPVFGSINGWGASAAYAFLSGCTRIYIIQSGGGGSIGTVLVHLDFSALLEAEGVRPTLIFEGAHKVDGNPYEALPETVRERLQGEVRKHYGMFVSTVAVGRGMDEAAIRATEARMYTGAEAVAAGLVDEVGTFEDALAAVAKARTVSSGVTQTQIVTKGTDMKKKALSQGRVAAEEAASSSTPAAACGTCGADGCTCGDACTATGCGCCDACKEAAGEGEGDDGGSSSNSAAKIAQAGTQDVGANVMEENRKLRAQLASARRNEVTMTARGLVDAAVRDGKMAPAQQAKDGKPATETVAALIQDTLISSALNDGCATCKATHTRTERMLALMPPIVPLGRLGVKPIKESASVIGNVSATSEQGDLHATIAQQLSSEGLQPGTKAWSKAYRDAHKKLSVGAVTE